MIQTINSRGHETAPRREVDEVDDLALFTIDEMLTAFSAVGLAATCDPSWSGVSGDGLYVATARESPPQGSKRSPNA